MADDYDLELKAVVKRFDGVAAVDRVSLGARHGEFLSLLGPSGCGKTTTLRLIAGFEQPDSGEILLSGRNVAGVAPNLRNVNTVFQHYALFPHMTVFRNIAYGPAIRGRPQREIAPLVAEMLRVVDLVGFDERFPHQLSGGQQQRVALARALINRPAVLLLDEPLGALDLQVRRRMQVELKHIQRSVGITFVYVTHDQEEALTLSDRIAVMNRGRVEQLGAPREIYDNPVSRFALEFVGSSNVFEAHIERIEGAEVEAVTAAGTRLRGLGRGGLAVGQTVALGIRPEKIALGKGGRPDAMQGTVVETLFQGASCHYRIRVPGGDEFLVHRQIGGDDGGHVWQDGDFVSLSWSVSSALVFTT